LRQVDGRDNDGRGWRAGHGRKDLVIYKVPGSFGIAAHGEKLAKSGRLTHHFVWAPSSAELLRIRIYQAEVSKGIAMVGLETEVPVVFGVLTTDTIEQAIDARERSR